MQQDAFGDADGQVEAPTGYQRAKSIFSTAVGAIVAMSLLMALGIWFYRLGVRDASSVPIIRAAAEPAKERPDDPGGLEAPHQDIESYEVTNDRTASAAAVVIAPEAPQPKPEDLPLGELAAAVTAQPTSASAPNTPATEGETDVGSEVNSVTGQDSQLALAPVPLSPTPEAEAEADAAAEAQTEPEAEPEPEPEPVVLSGTKLAPSASPTAPRRPSNLVQRTAAAADRYVQRQDDLARRAADSRVQIQLAANPDQQAVRQMWTRIRRANEDILRGRTLAVQSTVSGGTTFYRLRVGPFKDAAEARNVCQALKARGQDCIVARNS